MSAASSAPRWQRVIQDALKDDNSAIVYQLATIDTSSGSVPRVRSIGHCDFLSARSPANPILLATTDVRSDKAAQIAQNAHVELAWWLPKSKVQLRISGLAYLYPAPDFVLTGAKSVPEERKKRIEETVKELRDSFPGKELGGEGFDWEKERRARFDATPGHLRASLAHPVPGSRLMDLGETERLPKTLPKLEDAVGEEKALVEAALRNYSLMLIDPQEVDYVELAVIPNRRTRFFKEGEQWKEEALVL